MKLVPVLCPLHRRRTAMTAAPTRTAAVEIVETNPASVAEPKISCPSLVHHWRRRRCCAGSAVPFGHYLPRRKAGRSGGRYQESPGQRAATAMGGGDIDNIQDSPRIFCSLFSTLWDFWNLYNVLLMSAIFFVHRLLFHADKRTQRYVQEQHRIL